MAAFSCPLRIQLKMQGQSVAIVLGMWPGGVCRNVETVEEHQRCLPSVRSAVQSQAKVM